MDNIKQMYLELLKKTILFEIWREHEQDLIFELSSNPASIKSGINPEKHRMGEIWPKFAHSMIGRVRMDHLQNCMEIVLKENIQGDFIETGVWRGGSCIFMSGFLKANGISNRNIWVADSFEGLPAPNPQQYPWDKDNTLYQVDYLRVSLEEVKENFQKYGLLSDNVRFLKGWFKDTLPTSPIKSLAILRLDGDLYQSTMDSLKNLYHKVSPGGFIIVDDYALKTCQPAVHDFRRERGISTPLIPIDRYSVYWRKV